MSSARCIFILYKLIIVFHVKTTSFYISQNSCIGIPSIMHNHKLNFIGI